MYQDRNATIHLTHTNPTLYSTDVWALGCCLYSLAFLQNCFEEGSNLAILSRNYKIPEDNPYGEDLAELIDRMLCMNCKERADMTEVILCLSAIYSGRPLPPRKKTGRTGDRSDEGSKSGVKQKERVGTYRTDGQGIRKPKSEEKKPVEAKKLNPNSAAARRRKAAQTSAGATPVEGHHHSSRNSNSSKFREPRLRPSSGGGEFDHSFSDAFMFQTDVDNGGSAFSGADDPFHVGGDGQGHHTSGFHDTSQDDVFDFSSENGSGFDTFSDGSRSTGGFGNRNTAMDRALTKAVLSSTKANDISGDIHKLSFDNFRVSEENSAEMYSVMNSENDATTGILKRKKRGLRFFKKNEKDVEI